MNNDYENWNDISYKSHSNNIKKANPVRRSSIQDRAKEILEKNQGTFIDTFDNNDRLKSYEETLADLMDGITIPTEHEILVQSAASEITDRSDYINFDASVGSLGDSFDVSAADFEVGTFAARRTKEKTFDRRARRQSFDQAPTTFKDIKAKTSTSPEVTKYRKVSSVHGNGLQLSTALSSIHKSQNRDSHIEDNQYDLTRYGSLERSDGDIYNMLSLAEKEPITATFDSQIPVSRQSAVSFKASDSEDLDSFTSRYASELPGVMREKDHRSGVDNYDDHNVALADANKHKVSTTTGRNPISLYPSDEKGNEVPLEDDDDYSLDDFEEHDRLQASPSTNRHTDAPPSPIATTTIANAVMPIDASLIKSSEYTVPTVPMSHVDQIMQRWYNKDSDFLKMSLDVSYLQNNEVIDEKPSDDFDNRNLSAVVQPVIEPAAPIESVNFEQQPIELDVAIDSSVSPCANNDEDVLQTVTRDMMISPESKIVDDDDVKAAEHLSLGSTPLVSLQHPANLKALHSDKASSSPTLGSVDVTTTSDSLYETPSVTQKESQHVLQSSGANRLDDVVVAAVGSATQMKIEEKAVLLLEPKPNHLKTSAIDRYDVVTKTNKQGEVYPLQDLKAVVAPNRDMEYNRKAIEVMTRREEPVEKTRDETWRESEQLNVSRKHNYDAFDASAIGTATATLKKKMAAGKHLKSNALSSVDDNAGSTAKTHAGTRLTRPAIDKSVSTSLGRTREAVTRKASHGMRDREILTGKQQLVERNSRNKSSDFSGRASAEYLRELERDSQFEKQMRETKERLRQDFALLAREQRSVREREEDVSLREMVVLTKEGLTITQSDSSRSSLVSEQAKKIEQLESENLSLRDKEHALVSEINSLKASLYNQHQHSVSENYDGSRLVLGLTGVSSVISHAAIRRSKLPVFSPNRVVADGQDQSTTSKNVQVDLLEYEKLLRDHAVQESLIAAFQKESEEMTEVVRKRDAQDAEQRAAYFDQHEALIKEVNRLRNLTCQSEHSGVLIVPGLVENKHAEKLRNELELDNIISGLKERVAVAESAAGEREKRLQLQVDCIIKENRILTEQVSSLNLNKKTLLENEENKHNTIVQQLREELDHTSKKLNWYINNQKFVDEATKENDLLRKENKELKQQRLVSSKADADIQSERKDKTLIALKNKQMEDNVRIKELEELVSQLRSSLNKRNPNSVANLVQAASVSDAVHTKYQDYERTIATLRNEIVDIMNTHETKYRALRQEHSRIMLECQSRMSPSNETKVSDGRQDHISDLERENVRIKAYYSKKVDDMANRHEAQIKALKLKHKPMDNNYGSDNAMNAHGVSASPVDSKANYSHRKDKQYAMLLQENEVNCERISRLEGDLLKTSRELGRVRAEAASAAAARNTTGTQKDGVNIPPHSLKGDDNTIVGNIVRPAFQPHLNSSKATSCNEIEHNTEVRQCNEQLGQQQTFRHQLELQKITNVWNVEKEQLLHQLHSAEMQMGLLELKLQQKLSYEQHSPTTQFTSIETQLHTLEQRLQVREKEFMSAVDQSRSSFKLEKARLLVVHEQELREKEVQLNHFRIQLSELIKELHHLQSAGVVGFAKSD